MASRTSSPSRAAQRHIGRTGVRITSREARSYLPADEPDVIEILHVEDL